MPISYRIFPEYNLVVTRCCGVVTNAEFIATYDAILKDAARRPGMFELALLDEISRSDIDKIALRRVAEAEAMQVAGLPKRTAVLSRNPMLQIMSRLYKSMAEMGGAERVRQFEDLTEALAWLDCSDFPPERLEEVPRC